MEEPSPGLMRTETLLMLERRLSPLIKLMWQQVANNIFIKGRLYYS